MTVKELKEILSKENDEMEVEFVSSNYMAKYGTNGYFYSNKEEKDCLCITDLPVRPFK